jgi:hypothetical protein
VGVGGRAVASSAVRSAPLCSCMGAHHRGSPTRAETAEMLVIDVILRGVRVDEAAAHL